jgi:hypothetical protein
VRVKLRNKSPEGFTYYCKFPKFLPMESKPCGALHCMKERYTRKDIFASKNILTRKDFQSMDLFASLHFLSLAAAYPTPRRSPPQPILRPTKSLAHSMCPVPAPATTLPARPHSGWSWAAAVPPQMYVLPIRRAHPRLDARGVHGRPTNSRGCIRRCRWSSPATASSSPSTVSSGSRPLSTSTPRLISSCPYPCPCPVQVSGSGSGTAYPSSSRCKARQGEAGRRPDMADDHAQGLVHSDLDQEELVRPGRRRPPK